MSELIHHALFDRAARSPDAPALAHGARALSYGELARETDDCAQAFLAQGLQRGERVAVFLEKRVETVAALFGAAAAGLVFVPVNPLLRPEQVAHILADCAVALLVTSPARLAGLECALAACPALRAVLLTDDAENASTASYAVLPLSSRPAARLPAHRAIDTDMAGILYTSGSTGRPKGVVLSHRNLVAGAASVASYLGNTPGDRLLSVLPLSFDYGLSQLTTAFHSGASCVLLNYLAPRDILDAVEEYGITGLAAIPPLWMQLAQLHWPRDTTLRYLTNSGGAMPRATFAALRVALPAARVYLMYGLTEAFRSTYLPPEEADRRPGSIGRAIPNAEILVLRPDGTRCAPDEPGELVHRGALVALGYWNDPARTAERFRPLPASCGLPLPEIAVWSGDTVRMDADGYLYFIGRRDEMIKVSGYRISPAEVEEVLAAHPGVLEAVAFGVPHPLTGDAVHAAVRVAEGGPDAAALQAHCRRHLPSYMVPAAVAAGTGPLPRNANGKFDRMRLREGHLQPASGEAAHA